MYFPDRKELRINELETKISMLEYRIKSLETELQMLRLKPAAEQGDKLAFTEYFNLMDKRYSIVK